MKFYAYHGVFEEENRLGQRFEADVVLETDLKPASETDNLEKSVDYGEVYQITKKVVEGQAYDLVESIAEDVASELLSSFTIVQRVTVKIIKPDPPIPGHYNYVAIEIVREK